MSTIGARPNMNGNSEKDFIEAYFAMTKAIRGVESASSKMHQNVLHGRNYQHLPFGDITMDVDQEFSCDTFTAALVALEDIKNSLEKAILINQNRTKT